MRNNYEWLKPGSNMKWKSVLLTTALIFSFLCSGCRRNSVNKEISSITLGNHTVSVIQNTETSYSLTVLSDDYNEVSSLSLNELFGETNLTADLFLNLVVTEYSWFSSPVLCVGVPVSEKMTRYALLYLSAGRLHRLNVIGYGIDGFVYSIDKQLSTSFPEPFGVRGIEVGMPLAEGGSAFAVYRWDDKNHLLVYEANDYPVISEFTMEDVTLELRQTEYRKPDGPWNESFALAIPELYAGQFALVTRDSKDKVISKFLLYEVFGDYQAFSGRPPSLTPMDYNGDGQPDFSLGIENRYAIFTINGDGKILRLPVYDNQTDGFILYYSEVMSPLSIKEGAVLGQLPGKTGKAPTPVEYRWNGEAFVRD